MVALLLLASEPLGVSSLRLHVLQVPLKSQQALRHTPAQGKQSQRVEKKISLLSVNG